MVEIQTNKSIASDLSYLEERKPTVKTVMNKSKVQTESIANPLLWLRDANEVLNMKYTLSVTIMKKDLKLFPYKVKSCQALTADHITLKFEFANQTVSSIQSKALNIRHMWFSY